MRYHNLYSSIWEDEKFQPLLPQAKLLYIYLFSNQLCRLSGIYKISLRRIAYETDLPKVEDLLNILLTAGLVCYDFKKSILWVVGKIKHTNINFRHYEAMKSIANDLESAKGTHFYDYVFTKYPHLLDIALELENSKKVRYGSKSQSQSL